jgi:Na+/H+ antiporter NhaD/arsenite permease-like protein
MILTLILSALISIVLMLVGLLPNYTGLPTNISDVLNTLIGIFSKANNFFPFETLYTIAIVVFGIELSIFMFKIGNWIFNKIRGSG